MLRKYIHVKKNEILNLFKLQRDILRLNQNSDLEVKVVIAEGKAPGTSDITLKATDSFPYHLGTSVDDQGTRLTGKYRNTFSFRSSNLTGLGDNAFYSYILSFNAYGNYATYAIPIGTYGTKAAFDFTQFHSKLGHEYESYNILGDTQIYTPHLSQELALSDTFQASVDAGLEIKSSKKKIAGTLTSNDQLRLPYCLFDFTKLDALFGGGQTTFSPKFTFGTSGFLGASSRDHPSASRDGTGGFFVKYEQSLKRFQKLFFGSYMMLRSQFQLPNRTLPPSEQFQLGGAYSVRGYPEGDFMADYGAILNTEWYFPCYLFPKDFKLPYADKPLRRQIEPVLFFDLGGGGLMKHNPGEVKSKLLMGLGGGVRINFRKNLFLRLDWAHSVGGDGPAPGNGPSSFYLTFQFEV